MKLINRIMLKIVIIVLGIIIIPDIVNADVTSIYVGSEVIYPGETKSIYGGEVKFSGDSSNYTLTLKNVNINEYHKIDAEAYGVYFEDGNLTINLEGNNTISSFYEENTNVEGYYGIEVNNYYNLNIIGDGTLNINASDYNDSIIGLFAKSVTIGESSKVTTVNANLEGASESMVMLIYGDFNIYNANIKAKLNGYNIIGMMTATNDDASIKKSDINLNIEVSSESEAIYSYYGDLIIEDTDMLIKTNKKSGSNPYEVGLAYYKLCTIKDSRIVILSDNPDDSYSVYNTGGDNKQVKLIHTQGKEFLLLANVPFEVDDVIYSGITNKMVYVSDTSLDTVKQSDTYNLDNLKSEKFMVVTTGISNSILEGNNQDLPIGNLKSYNVLTNHFRYLVNSVKLDNQELDIEDYELTKNGEILLTTSGLNKLSSLELGSHKLDISYYYGNPVSVNINIVKESILENPKTGDNILIYLVMITVLIITSIVRCLKNNVYN